MWKQTKTSWYYHHQYFYGERRGEEGHESLSVFIFIWPLRTLNLNWIFLSLSLVFLPVDTYGWVWFCSGLSGLLHKNFSLVEKLNEKLKHTQNIQNIYKCAFCSHLYSLMRRVRRGRGMFSHLLKSYYYNRMRISHFSTLKLIHFLSVYTQHKICFHLVFYSLSWNY